MAKSIYYRKRKTNNRKRTRGHKKRTKSRQYRSRQYRSRNRRSRNRRSRKIMRGGVSEGDIIGAFSPRHGRSNVSHVERIRGNEGATTTDTLQRSTTESIKTSPQLVSTESENISQRSSLTPNLGDEPVKARVIAKRSVARVKVGEKPVKQAPTESTSPQPAPAISATEQGSPESAPTIPTQPATTLSATKPGSPQPAPTLSATESESPQPAPAAISAPTLSGTETESPQPAPTAISASTLSAPQPAPAAISAPTIPTSPQPASTISTTETASAISSSEPAKSLPLNSIYAIVNNSELTIEHEYNKTENIVVVTGKNNNTTTINARELSFDKQGIIVVENDNSVKVFKPLQKIRSLDKDELMEQVKSGTDITDSIVIQ